MTKTFAWPSAFPAGQVLRCAVYGLVFSLLTGCLCMALVPLLPSLGGLFTEDEMVLRYLASVGQAQVSPAWHIPLLFSLLLLGAVCIVKLRQHRRPSEPGAKRALPLFFPLSLWIGFVPVFILTALYTKVNTVPLKVVIVFLSGFLQ